MSIKKILILVGLCGLFIGCSTTGTNNMAPLATKEGSPTTQMGVRYLLGRGVPQDDTKAFNYFNQAANDNDPFAQNEVAYMYAAGKGTSQDYAKAFTWYQKAAQNGLASAQYNLGFLYLHGLGTPKNKTLAMQWFQKSADNGFEPAKLALQRGRG